MPRFKDLPELAQTAMCAAFKQLVDDATHLFMPVVPVKDWVSVFRKLNVKIRPGGLPSATDMTRVVEYLESTLGGPTLCLRCGSN